MPVSVELILAGAALLLAGFARLRGKRPDGRNRTGTANFAKTGSGAAGAARFDWMAVAMTLFGGVAAGLGLVLAGIDLLKALFSWLKS